MNQWIEQIRSLENDMSLAKKIRNSGLIFLLGIALGIFSKWLDNLPINDEIWWQRVIGILDLGNVFSLLGIWILLAVAISVFSKTPYRAGVNGFLFFLGMNISYHLYTIYFAGFNPMQYMMIWYGITAFSPVLAFVCWYARGKGKFSICVCIAILAVMLLCSFSIGMWYFSFVSILDTIIFLLMVLLLYDTPRNTVISLSGAIVLAFLLRIFIL